MTTTAPITDGDAVLHTDPPGVRPAAWTAAVRAGWPVAAAVAVAAVLSFGVLPHLNGYRQVLVGNCGVAIMLAVSLTVVNGFTGQFSIGHSGFLALGGYGAAALVYYGTYRLFGDLAFHGGRLSWDGSGPRPDAWFTRGDGLFLFALAFGGVVAAAVGWVVGLPSLRLRGDYLAIVTLGFCEIVRVILQSTGTQLTFDDSVNPHGLSDPIDLDPITRTLPQQMTHLGGALGFTSVPVYASPFWIAVGCVLTLVLTVRLKYSAYGRSMLSIREDDIAAQAVGVNITRYKVRAFVFSAFFAGVAGGLLALKNGTINAGELGFQRSFDYVIMVVLGGLGSVSGAALAAILVTLLPEWLRGVQEYRMVIYALLLIVVMIVRPQGLLGLRELWDYLPARLRWWERGPSGLPLKTDGAP